MRANDFITEKWSAKYKRSINCNNPKGFSQRAHCQGRKKKVEENVNFVKPQFDVEWEEANRYDFLDKLGQQGWEELAKTGKAVTVTKNSVKKIGNTGADSSETLDDLEPDKVARLKKAMKSGTVEMPIVMKQPNGELELIAGNTRLIGLINTVGKATVWYIDASKLEENFADGKKKTTEGTGASAGGGTPGSAGAGGSSLGLPYPSSYEEENDKFKRKGQERTVAMTTEQKIYKRDELPQLNKSHFENGDFEVEEGEIKLSKLIPIQTERVKGLVKKTIKMIEDGKDKPLIIDNKGRIVNGHHRYDAYKKLGYNKVPVLKVNATVEELIDKYMK